MQADDFDDILGSAHQLREAVASIYKDITGEDLDLEGVVRHYPIVALGLATGAGAIAGWYFARRSMALPPPLDDLIAEEPGEPGPANRRLPSLSVSPVVSSAARKWYADVLEPRLRTNLDAAMKSVEQRGFSGLLDSAASILDSKRDTHVPEDENGAEGAPPPAV